MDTGHPAISNLNKNVFFLFMKQTAIVNLPLHGGKAPRWLFGRMVEMSSAITNAVVEEYGQNEFIKRISDPYWFQALSCVIGYDWHSSGTTTVTCGALKEAMKKQNLGVFIAGGKGRTSRKTPAEIEKFSENTNLSTSKIERLKYSSKMSAKVDSAVLQDNYQLYHHCFFFTEKGKWSVVQQGMNNLNNYARRYHWLSDGIKSFVDDPQNAVCCDLKEDKVLNMGANESRDARKTSVDIIKDNPEHLEKYFTPSVQRTLFNFNRHAIEFTMPPHHEISDMANINIKTLQKAYEIQPKNYEELIAIKGVGPKTVRSLALISSLIYGDKVSWEDPVKYSFAHGGKDGIPYPVDKQLMDSSTETLRNAIRQSKLGQKDKLNALKKLSNFY